jgi:hypothetical protein
MGCGHDFGDAPRGSRSRGAVRTLLHWVIGLALVAVGGVAILGLVLEWENRQNGSGGSEAAPTSTAASATPATAARAAAAPSRAPERHPATQAPTSRMARPAEPPDPADAGPLAQWRAAGYSSRLTYSANYVSARARFSTTQDLKNVAIWMESCISMQQGFTTVGQASSACFSDLLRRQQSGQPKGGTGAKAAAR